MSTADSQLLVAASSVTEDLGRIRGRAPSGLGSSRVVVALLCVLAASLALLVPDTIFRRVLFAWHAVGSAFGPLLVMTLWRGTVAPAWRVAALSLGFMLTVILSWTIDSPGDWVERLIPLALALVLAWLGTGPFQRNS
jgi:sodium/proline symporter